MSGCESRDVVDLVASSEYSREAEDEAEVVAVAAPASPEVVAVAAPASPEVREVGAPGARRKRPRPEGPAALDAQLAQQLHEELNGAPAAPRAGGERLWHAEAQTLSDDLAPLLRQRVSGAAGEVRLCDGPLFYLAQQDKWSCGYRCLQMVIAALRHGSAAHDAALCFPGLGPKSVPDVRSVQLGVDLAHLAGVDPEGFVETGLLEGSRGWLGATDGECASLPCVCACLRLQSRSLVAILSRLTSLILLVCLGALPCPACVAWRRAARLPVIRSVRAATAPRHPKRGLRLQRRSRRRQRARAARSLP